MVSPHGIKLAAHIISSMYGELCSKVCECLLARGALSLAEITRFTELSKENAVNCLRVLIQQNCVQAFARPHGGGFQQAPRITTYYLALFDNVIHKMRAPKFMNIVKEELGDHCLEIFQGLIQNGRLSFNQIVDRSEQTIGSSDALAVRECFSKLLAARFIERCPAPEPLVSPPDAVVPGNKKKSTKVKQVVIERTTEELVLEAAAPSESRRFLMNFDDESTKTAKESADTASVGKKRKKDAMTSEDDLLDADKENEVLWRVNFEELVCCLKQKACISSVEKRINKEAGIVLTAILELDKQFGGTRQKANTSGLSINAIYEEVIKKEDGHSMDIERVRTTLEQLGCKSLPSDIDEEYSLDVISIIEIAQNEEIESLVLRRYGREAYRIFRLLSTNGSFIDTKKISDITFVEKKDTAKILYRLWKDEYLHMEKVVIGPRENQAPIMLWRVIKEPLHKQVLDEMYHAALNLRLRIAHEHDQGKEVLQLPREKLVGEMDKKLKLLIRVRVILESSLLNLDDAILLFNDF